MTLSFCAWPVVKKGGDYTPVPGDIVVHAPSSFIGIVVGEIADDRVDLKLWFTDDQRFAAPSAFFACNLDKIGHISNIEEVKDW